jgi:hypothetical protein
MRPLLPYLCTLFIFAAPTAGCGEDGVGPDPGAEISVLFIGNSLTTFNDMPGMVSALLDSIGAGPISVREQTGNNTGLEDHWNSGGLPAIRSGAWDFVVLQQGPSATEGRPSLWEFAERFADEIRAIGAMPALYMVWPSGSRSFDFDGRAYSAATPRRSRSL